MKANRPVASWPFLETSLLALGLCGSAGAGDVLFVRGDVNGDGIVSIADVYSFEKYMRWYGPPPSCWQAADADHDDAVDWLDKGRLWRLLFQDGAPLDPPFPAAGPAEPAKGLDGWLNCAAAGDGAPLEDPAAKIEILDAVVPGGSDGLARVVLSISASAPVAACSWRMRFDGRLFERTKGCEVRDLTRESQGGSRHPLGEGELRFGFLPGASWLQASEGRPALELTFCLKEDAPPGEHPLTLEAGELVHSDSGRAIHPVLKSRSLTLLSGLDPGSGCPPDPSVGGADFVRGDANGDRTVSISDAYFILSYSFLGGYAPECILATDADNNGAMQLTDAFRILTFLFWGDVPPPPPFPNPGPDDGGNSSYWGENPCPSYGNGSPLKDPKAELTVLDAVAQGGDDGAVVITVALSSAAPVAGYSGSILADPGLFRDRRPQTGRDLTGTFRQGFNSLRLRGGILQFGFLPTFTEKAWISAGEDVSVLEITACLREGTTIGQYPLALLEGELADAASGRAIRPALRSGTLTVLSRVSQGAACAVESDSRPPVPAVPPPP
ncbi:MAG: hypothetical protein HY721_25330, partial [Planctomycetes bacterium]|nr:hypothetical protein [Planctomycetota bacterium]